MEEYLSLGRWLTWPLVEKKVSPLFFVLRTGSTIARNLKLGWLTFEKMIQDRRRSSLAFRFLPTSNLYGLLNSSRAWTVFVNQARIILTLNATKVGRHFQRDKTFHSFQPTNIEWEVEITRRPTRHTHTKGQIYSCFYVRDLWWPLPIVFSRRKLGVGIGGENLTIIFFHLIVPMFNTHIP